VRLRNHALDTSIVETRLLYDIVDRVLDIAEELVLEDNFGKMFANCVELIPFVLKHRRYVPDFLPPDSPLASRLQNFLVSLDVQYHDRLPRRFRRTEGKESFPALAIKFLKRCATDSDLGGLLGAVGQGDTEDGGSDDDND
jgi:hypothetical protein